jgi:hypothetical protein
MLSVLEYYCINLKLDETEHLSTSKKSKSDNIWVKYVPTINFYHILRLQCNVHCYNLFHLCFLDILLVATLAPEEKLHPIGRMKLVLFSDLTGRPPTQPPTHPPTHPPHSLRNHSTQPASRRANGL